LIDLVCGDREFAQNAKLFGSTPPLSDALWEACEKVCDVSTRQRSTWTGKEKGVDAELMLAAQDAMFWLPHLETIVITSGDGDFTPLLEAVLKYNKKMFPEGGAPVKLEIWSWEKSLAKALKDLVSNNSECLSIHLLDPHIETIGFVETKFDIKKSRIPADRTLVIRNVAEIQDEVNTFLSNFQVPTYKYLLLHTDLAVIMTEPLEANYFTEIFQDTVAKLGDSVVTYQAWLQTNEKKLSSGNGKVQLSPYYGQLENTPRVQPPGRDTKKETENSGAEVWTVKEPATNNRPAVACPTDPTDICYYSTYCKYGLNCQKSHLQFANNHFNQNFKADKLRKQVPCEKKACNAATCDFLHTGDKKLCLTCNTTPDKEEHKWGYCPEIKAALKANHKAAV